MDRWALGVVCVVLMVIGHCTAQQYFPSQCESRCQSLSDFQQPLPRRPVGVNTRAAKWSIVALNQIRDNLGRTSPPGVSRALAIFSTCMFEGLSLFNGDLQPFAAKDLFKVGVFDPELSDRAIDGAAVRALTYIFQGLGTVGQVEKFLGEMGDVGGEDISSFMGFMGKGQPKSYNGFPDIFDVKKMTSGLAMKAGSIACDKVIEKVGGYHNNPLVHMCRIYHSGTMYILQFYLSCWVQVVHVNFVHNVLTNGGLCLHCSSLLMGMMGLEMP